MDQHAPHNLPFEPEDPLAKPVPPSTPPVLAPTAIPKVDLPLPAVPSGATPPTSRFLSEEASSSMLGGRTPTGPKQPEDMFSGIETQVPRPAANRVLPNDPLTSTHASYGKYILLICSLVAGLGIIGAALWYFAIHRPAQQAEQEAIVTPVVPPAPMTPPASEPVGSEPVAPPSLAPTPSSPSEDVTVPPAPAISPADPVAPVVTTPPPGTNIPPPTFASPTPSPAATSSEPTPVFVDSDSDALSDTREQELGTDPRNPDSDADTLSDGDEVLKYGTNPLKMDTDGDTYTDGLEVRGGYDPRGTGKCTKPDCVQ